MAIDHEVYGRGQSNWGWLEEAAFGTPNADASNYEILEGNIPTGINYGVTRNQSVKHGGGLVLESDHYYTTQDGMMIEIPFSDVIVRRKDLAPMIYSVTQAFTSEAGVTPFQKVFTINNSLDQPNFSNDLGYFSTVFIQDPIDAYHRKFTSCVLRELTLATDFGGDGLLRASGTFVTGQKHDEVTLSGTPVYNAQTYWNMLRPAVKQINAVDVVVYEYSLTINNGLVRIGMDSNGEAEGYSMAKSDAGLAVTGSISVKYDAAVDSLLADSIAGTQRSLNYELGATGVAGFYDNTLNVVFGDPDHTYDDDKGQIMVLPFTAMNDTAGATALATFQVADGFQRSW